MDFINPGLPEESGGVCRTGVATHIILFSRAGQGWGYHLKPVNAKCMWVAPLDLTVVYTI